MEMASFPLSKHLWELLNLITPLFEHPIFLCVLLLLISLILLFSNRSYLAGYQALKLPPSPWRLPVIGNLHQLGRFPHRSFQALSERYGPIMLLQLGQCPTVVISSPEMVKEIVKNHDVVFSGRPKATASDALFYGGKDIAFSTHNEYWKQARKICALHLLSLKRVKSFQSVREEETSAMIETLRKASLSGSSVNLSQILVSTGNNMTSRCILGQRYDTDEEEGDEGLIGKLGRQVMVQLVAFCVGDFFPSFGWIDVVRGFRGTLESTSRALDVFYNQVIEERCKAMDNYMTATSGDGTDSKDFMDILLQLQKDPNVTGLELTPEHVKAILQDMLLGGVDTTSTASEWLMAELLRNPRVMKKVQEEVRSVVGEKAKVEMDDINRMAYFKNVVKENLRLHLPVPLFVPRETSKSVQIGGYHIPAKTKVFINGWAIHMNPDLWDKPEEFIPERFENNPLDFKSQEHFQFIPFGFGRRQCPGMTFAIFTMEYLVANLLYWFDWTVRTSEDLDMTEVFGITVHKKFPIHAVPTLYSP